MAKYDADDLTYPFISLLVSGGHTLIVKVSSSNEYKVIGQTKDDAVGEAFDKTAKLLKLVIQAVQKLKKALLSQGKHDFSFPRPMIDSNDLNLVLAA